MNVNQQLKEWEKSGEYINFGPFDHRVFVKEIGERTAASSDTLLLIHGFPESSWSFHKVVAGLIKKFKRIILCDMLGYGFSDKPEQDYTYSLFEQADLILHVWGHFGIKGGHVLSHDMGDSVGTEIISRHVSDLLPAWFSDGIKSFTFTNGSMVLGLADLRITQKLLLSRYGKYMRNLLSYKVFSAQIKSAHGNSNLSDEDVEGLWLINTLKDGNKKTYLTIKYLNDRKRFEKTRWLPSLSQLDVPIHICWGEDDAVARIEMAHFLKNKICPSAQMTTMKSTGHFCQLGNPKNWLQSVIKFYDNLS